MRKTVPGIIVLLILIYSLCPGMLYSQNILRGRVLGGVKDTLIGATVQVKGTSEGTNANENGEFELHTTATPPFTLIVESFGYNTKEVEVATLSDYVDIIMEVNDTLNEVVITAVGIKSNKKSIGYTLSEVKSKDLTDSHEPNITTALSGKIAGVQINNSSGAPGASTQVRIRGNTSALGENSPLFVVDGIPIDNSNEALSIFNANAVVNQSNRAIDLNPNDIEKMTVLKGPAAAALYGIRAANGAIIITTKKGEKQEDKKPRITYTTSYSTEEINRRYQPVQSKFSQGTQGVYRTPGTVGSEDSWGALLDTLYYSNKPSIWDENGSIVGKNDPSSTGKPINRYDNTDFFVNGYTWDNHLSLSGATDNAGYYLSAGRLEQKGIVPNTDFYRNTFKLRSNFDVSKRINIGGSANYVVSGANNRMIQGGAPSGVLRGAMSAPQNFDNKKGQDKKDAVDAPSVYQFENGDQRAFGGGSRGFDNPYWSLNKNPHSDQINRFIGIFQTDYKIATWLNATFRGGGDFSQENRTAVYSKASVGFPQGTVIEYGFLRRDINTDLILTATKNLNKNLGLTVIAGHNYFNFYRNNLTAQGQNLTIPNYFNINAGSTINATQVTRRRELVAGYLDVKLDYKSWLFAEVTGRNEWTSTLAKGKNAFFYPSVNTAFVFSEAFKLKNNFFSFGKVRATAAQVGNDASPYSLDSYFATTNLNGQIQGQILNFPFNGLAGYSLANTQGNFDLKPERISALEAGAELRFFKSRIGIDVAVYNNQSKDQILPVSIPASTGFSSYFLNAGTISNKGIEVVLDAKPVSKSDFEWEVSLNFSHNKNRVEKLAPGLNNLDLGNSTNGAAGKLVEGEEYGVLWGTGFLKNNDGQTVIDDKPTLPNGNPNPNYGYPVIDPNQKIIGNPNPKFNAGLRNSITWKRITLSFLFDTRYKFDMYNSTKAHMLQTGVAKETEDRNQEKVFEGVKSDGTTNDIVVSPGETWYRSTINIGETSIEKDLWWFRMRDINLSFRLPTSWSGKTQRVKNLDVTFFARNLFVLTNYTGSDPDVNTRGGATNGFGMDFWGMPGTRSYGTSLKISF